MQAAASVFKHVLQPLQGTQLLLVSSAYPIKQIVHYYPLVQDKQDAGHGITFPLGSTITGVITTPPPDNNYMICSSVSTHPVWLLKLQ